MKDTPLQHTEDFSNLIGIEYSEMNCWDLTRHFYRIYFNLELKHIATDPEDRKATESLIYHNKGEFDRVYDPQFGDIITIKVRGIESHIAVCLGGGLMLHTSNATGSVVDRIERWVKTITGYYRPRQGQN